MKRKRGKNDKPDQDNEPLPDWLGGEDLKDPPELEELAEELDDDDLPANIEKGIRDLPVWQDLVARVGIEEARRILRCGLLAGQLPECNPEN